MDKFTEDRQLVADFLNGDEHAFKKIADKYSRRIYWHAYGILNNHFDADEITQTVLIVMYKKLKNFNFNSSLYTWIYKITKTRSLNLLSRNKLKRMFSLDSDDLKSVQTKENLIDNIETSEKLNKVEQLLKKLPPKQREVFIMKTFESMTYEEISEVTGKSVGGLKANYFHAIKKITEKFDEEN
ncbi:MAG: RNA polymerase sigma factor [Bacteroidota bacterium]